LDITAYINPTYATRAIQLTTAKPTKKVALVAKAASVAMRADVEHVSERMLLVVDGACCFELSAERTGSGLGGRPERAEYAATRRRD
jgi:hypothetical protein